MTDLERFFFHLVSTLAAADPARLRAPLSVADIQFSVLPYRTHRRALALDSSEDYEALLLRLVSGEGGLVRTDPAEVQARLGQEAQSANPDLGLLREHGDALVTLSGAAVRRILDAGPHDGYAPPPAQPGTNVSLGAQIPLETIGADRVHTARPVDLSLEGEHELELELPAAAESLPLDEIRTTTSGAGSRSANRAAPMCLYCGGTLPTGRAVKFCPHCGESQTVRCPECQSEVELSWRHCVSCGAAVGDR